MVNNVALSVGHASCWQLRAECWAASSRGDRRLVEHVTETMRELDLQPLQLERIQLAVLETVQRASLRQQPARPFSPVHIRIWVAGEYVRGCGWGFFIVEKPGNDLQTAPVEAERLVELFLYQERDS